MESVTAWHPKSVKPVRVGAYEVRRKPNGQQVVRWYAWWNGKFWGLTAQTPEGAKSCKDKPSMEARRGGGFEWRGRAKP